MVYNIDKMLKDSGDKIQSAEAAPVKAEVETVLAEAKKLLEGTPSSKDIKAQLEKLTNASHKLAEIVYKATAAQAAAGGAAPGGPAAGAGAAPEAGAAPTGDAKKEGEVIDAEYVDDNEKK
jgi:molecular chaperone DnaK